MQPHSPSPDFDFMLKNNQPAKRGLTLPMPNLPKPIKIALAILAGLILIIIVFSVLSNRNKGSAEPLVGVVARVQETLRVTAMAQQQLGLKDPQTLALAATVNSALSSDKKQISSYLVKNHLKVSANQLAADTDKSTDSSLQTASQNNNQDRAYVSYIKSALSKYQTDLQNASKTAGPNGQKILAGSIESTRALLNSAPIKL
jgi:hypothetical protein